jgi:hypothetical protein
MITVVAGELTAEKELEKLREAYGSLKDVVRGINSAIYQIDNRNFDMAKAHLNAAKWHVGEANKKITDVGQNRNQKADVGQP